MSSLFATNTPTIKKKNSLLPVTIDTLKKRSSVLPSKNQLSFNNSKNLSVFKKGQDRYVARRKMVRKNFLSKGRGSKIIKESESRDLSEDVSLDDLSKYQQLQKKKKRLRQNKMDQMLPLLYIPKSEISSKSLDSNCFKSFNLIKGLEVFREKMNTEYPPDSMEGLRERLKHNQKTERACRVTMRKFQVDSTKRILSLIKKDRKRKVKIYKKSLEEHSEAVGENFTQNRTQTNKNHFSPSERISNIRTYTFFWKSLECEIPLEAREGGSFTKIGKEGWLLGGTNENMIYNIYKINLENNDITKAKAKPEINFPRFNHTTCAYKNNLLIFGGEKINFRSFNSKHILNDTKVFKTKTDKWMMPESSGTFIRGRRNHIAVVFSKYMLIHGGMDEHDNVLRDCLIYNIGKLYFNLSEAEKWGRVHLDHDMDAVTHHAAIPVFSSSNKFTELYSRNQNTMVKKL